MDGFESVAASSLGEGGIWNLEPYRNTYSPFSSVLGKGPIVAGDEVLVDTYFGLAYDSWVNGGGAPYGLTDEFPLGPFDDLADSFSRVPFARIPCISAGGRASVLAAIDRIRATYPGLTLLFRGQHREYILGRSPETLNALYGGEVKEPSLLTSADRSKTNIDSVGPVWCGMLRWLLDVWATARDDQDQFKRIHELGQHYLFHRFALAMAQHYGLPSAGLDVTDSLEVALFFALHEFSTDPKSRGWSTCTRVVRGSERPVLYVFGLEGDRDYLRFEIEFLGQMPVSRPERQSAFFLGRGWGMARNRAAYSILASIHLEPEGDYEPLPGVEHLFPGPGEDLFGKSLESARQHLRAELPELGRFLERFAWVCAAD